MIYDINPTPLGKLYLPYTSKMKNIKIITELRKVPLYYLRRYAINIHNHKTKFRTNSNQSEYTSWIILIYTFKFVYIIIYLNLVKAVQALFFMNEPSRFHI